MSVKRTFCSWRRVLPSEFIPLSPQVKFSLEALELLEQYPWPGNIRELENAVVRAAAICDGTIRVKDLPERVQKFQTQFVGESTEADGNEEGGEFPTFVVAGWLALSTIEGRYVARVLEHTGGNKQAAARLLDVDRKTLDRMIKRHNLVVERTARFPSQAA